ncbi:hypothetical protein SLA2020_324870 [Shorea laevis]
MKVLSYNVRGFGGGGKKREVREMIAKERLDVVFIQETKIDVLEERISRAIWGRGDFDWVMKSAIGSSGGILCLWNQNSIKAQNKVEGFGFCGFEGQWGSEGVPCIFINVYAPCDKQERRRVWTELQVMLSNYNDRWWCIGGDFNAIRSVEEK